LISENFTVKVSDAFCGRKLNKLIEKMYMRRGKERGKKKTV